MAFLSANGYFGLIKEATRGTLPSSGTPTYIPVASPQVTPNQKFLRDEAFRGSPVMVYDQIQGVRSDDYDAKFYLYADTFPNLVVAVLGGTDTVTGSGVYTHKIGLYNNAATGSQPPSYSLLDFDGANYFTLTGAQADQLEITAGAETAAEATIKFMANPYTSYTSAPTPFTTLTLGTEHMIPAWDTVVTVGGTTLTYISELTLTLARKTAPIFTMGNQAPHVVFAGPLEVSGKFTAVLNSNADIWSTGTSAEALTYSPEAVTITLTDPNDITSGTNNSIEFTMSAVQFQNVKRTRGKEYVEVEVEFTASANTTDAVTGYAPISATIVNAIATAYN